MYVNLCEWKSTFNRTSGLPIKPRVSCPMRCVHKTWVREHRLALVTDRQPDQIHIIKKSPPWVTWKCTGASRNTVQREFIDLGTCIAGQLSTTGRHGCYCARISEQKASCFEDSELYFCKIWGLISTHFQLVDCSYLPQINESGRVVQPAHQINHSIDYLQISYPRSTFWIKKMSHPIDQSMEIRECKRMKAERGEGRPVNTQSYLHEDTVEDRGILENCPMIQEPIETPKHSITMKVDAALLRFVKGKRGKVQKKIEEMGVKIHIVSSGEDYSVVVDGPSIEIITAAANKIQQILDEAVESSDLQYSHFISLPLAVHPALVDKLTNFQKSILELIGRANNEEDSGSGSSGDFSEEDSSEELDKGAEVAAKINAEHGPRIDKSIFIKPKTFHLTVLMLKLWNNERLAAAAEALQKVSPQVMEALQGRPIAVSLKGLKCMKGKPAKAHVLYAHVEEVGGGGRLFHACQVIIDAFLAAGLVLEKDARHVLKLHATVMNTRYRKPKVLRKWRIDFDARPVLRHYGSEDWGEYVIHEAHLSKRFSYDENGYYHCCASIPFPEIAEEADI